MVEGIQDSRSRGGCVGFKSGREKGGQVVVYEGMKPFTQLLI